MSGQTDTGNGKGTGKRVLGAGKIAVKMKEWEEQRVKREKVLGRWIGVYYGVCALGSLVSVADVMYKNRWFWN